MRSLKIIIFRDTDKPYTIIIPSTVLVTLAFAVIGIFTLLTFSLAGNVMLYAENIDHEERIEQFAANSAAEEELKPEEDRQTPAESEGQQQENGLNEVEQTAGEILDDVNTEEQQPSAEDGNGSAAAQLEQPVETENTETPEAFTAASFDLAEQTAEAEAILIGDAVVNQNSVSVVVQVRKIRDEGVEFNGKFIAGLADVRGEVFATYPRSVNLDQNQVLNPDNGNTFRIRHRRNYNLTIPTGQGEEPAYLMLYIFNADTGQLQWRRAIALQ